MAVNIGPKIGLEGEAEYRKSLQNIIQQQKTLNSELGKTTSAFDKNTKASEKVKTQREYLTKAIEQQEQKVFELTQGLEKCSEAEGENATKTLKWKEAVNNAETELNNLKSQLNELPSGIQLFGQSMQECGEKLKNIGSSITDVGKKIAPLSAAVAGLGVYAVKSGAEFDQAMSSVKAISGATGDELENLKEKAKELGSTTAYSASDVAEAMTDMAKAGWSASDIMDGMAGVLEAATASGEDLASVSTIVADTITSFKLSAADASRVADVLVEAANSGTIDISDLGESFKNVAPLATSMGFSLEETTVALEALSTSGIKGANAGTGLKSMLSQLVKPSETVAGALEDLGITIADDEGNMKSLSQILSEMRPAFANLTEEERNYYATTIAGRNGVSSMLTLLNMTQEEYDALGVSLQNCSGIASDTASVMQDNLASQWEILKNKAQVLGIELAENVMPTLMNLVNTLGSVVDWFSNLNEGTQDFIIKAGLIVALAGPLLIFGGKLVSGIGSLISVGGTLLSGTSKLASGIGTIASKVSGAVSGIKNVGDTASVASGGVASAATSFGQLAGQALSLVALGAGILLAAKGLSELASASVQLASGGVGAVATMVLMVGAIAGLAVGAAALGPALTAGSLGFIAFGAAMVGIGAGVSLICDGVAKLSPELENIATYGLSASVSIAALAVSSTALGVGATACGVGVAAMDLAMAGLALTLAGINLTFGSLPKTVQQLADNSKNASTNLIALNLNVITYKNRSAEAKTNTDSLKTSIGNLDTKLKNLNSTLNTLKSSFTNFNTQFTTMLTNMNNNASKQLDSLVSKFKNTKLSLDQNIALPHFSMWGSFNARTGSVPSVGVSWYKKAYDNAVMFSSPTVLSTASGLKGFGDGNGNEIVIGENKLLNTITTAVQRGNSGGMVVNMTINASEGMDVNELASKVEDRLNRALQRKKGAFSV